MVALIPLGELIVRIGLVSREQLEAILAQQRADANEGRTNSAPGPRLGRLLLRAGLLTDGQLTQALSQQLSVPWVSLRHIPFTRPLLDLIPAAVAEQYRLLPIHIRRVRGVGNVLYVATADPLDEQALRAAADCSGLPVRPMIACHQDIGEALLALYGVRVSVAPEERDGRTESEEDEPASIETIYPDSVRDSSPRPTPPPLSRRAPSRNPSEPPSP